MEAIRGYDAWKITPPEEPYFPEVCEESKESGYEEIGTGIFVSEEDAYDYAMERISQDEDLKKEFVEWFYSGNWVYEDGRETHT